MRPREDVVKHARTGSRLPRPARPDASGLGSLRSRRLVTGILTAVFSRGINLLVPLLLIPVTLSYLGPDLYGLWMAATALTGMVAFADLGMGNALMTRLAPCYSYGDPASARRYISSAYVILAAVASTGCGLLWLFSDLIPWTWLFNAGGPVSASDARLIPLIWLTGFLVNVPVSLVSRVQYAYQRVGQSNLWQAAGSVAVVPLAYAAVREGLPPGAVVAAIALGPVLAGVANSLWTYGRQLPQIAPRLPSVDRELGGRLLRLSGGFFLLTMVMSAAVNADTLIVAHRIGLGGVTAYAVPAWMFNQLGMIITMVNTPLWSANGEALTRRDYGWVRRTVRRMTVISTLVALVPSVVLLVAGDRVLAMWLDPTFEADRWLLGGLAAWVVMLAAISPRFMVQNAAGIVRPQLLGYVLYLVVSVVAKWYAVRWCGIPIIPYIGVVGYALTVLPAALIGYRRAFAAPPGDRDATGHGRETFPATGTPTAIGAGTG